MITACKSYLTEHGYKTVWDYQQEELIAKLKNCIRLNEEYQRCFQKTKQRLEENPDERQFEFSEMYIFGKINTFARRLHKITEMLDTMKAFSRLGDSRIEGMEQLWNKFLLIVTTMKKKPYDLLDYRKMDFDADFEEFKRQINELQVSYSVALYASVFNSKKFFSGALHSKQPHMYLHLPNLVSDWKKSNWQFLTCSGFLVLNRSNFRFLWTTHLTGFLQLSEP